MLHRGGKPEQMADRIKRFITISKKARTPLILIAILAVAGVGAFFLWGNQARASDYITGKIERSTVEVTVAATGTVQAVTTVQVGSQVSGTVAWLGADFNSQVKRGQLIAKLDPAVFQAQVDNARANVLNAEAAVQASASEINNQKANLKAAMANLEVSRVQREDAIALVKRYQELKNVLSGRDIEAAQAQANAAAGRYEQAAAQVTQIQAGNEFAKAKLEQSKAALTQAKAQLQQSTLNLDHAIIASPIDGVVVSRNVDVGQTVAASLQAPTLFTIANDLTKMQVLASIDEADIGQIRQGIKASFTVDAFPGEVFTGEISQLRLNAQTLQNVVTYSAVIEFSNPDLKLRPGMTTNITIPIAKRENVLTVPNAALRFRPNLSEEEQKALREKMEARRRDREANSQGGEAKPQQPEGQGKPDAQPQQPEGQPKPEGQAQPPGGGRQQGGEGGQRRQAQMIWVLVGAKTLEPRFVRTGLTNGRVTEIISGDVHEGDVIVIGENDANGGNRPQQTTPFGQRPPGGGMRR
jgi:HlyD family secretion protein